MVNEARGHTLHTILLVVCFYSDKRAIYAKDTDYYTRRITSAASYVLVNHFRRFVGRSFVAR